MLGRGLTRESSLADLLRRPEVSYASLMTLPGAGPGVDAAAVIEQLEVQARYAGYIDRQREEIERLRNHEETALPADIAYDSVRGLSTEARQVLERHRPATVGQAARIPGITPTAVSLLLVHVKKRSLGAAA